MSALFPTLLLLAATHADPAAARETEDGVVPAALEEARAHRPRAPCPWVWTEEDKLTASDATLGDRFGRSVSLSGDTALVGATGDDDGGDDSGSAYVFLRSGSAWAQQAKLTTNDPAPYDLFGWCVALQGDTAMIGAMHENGSTGAAYVFVRSGATWAQRARLIANDGGGYDYFGCSVSFEGATALIGSIDDNHLGHDAGATYVFVRSGAGWIQQAKLIAPDLEAWDQFGVSVSLCGDTALIGADHHDGDGPWNSGSAYVFTRSGTSWIQQARLRASDAAGHDLFGCSVSLSGDTALIGTDRDSAYAFVRSGTVWAEQAKLTASSAPDTAGGGWSVCLRGDTALIGSPGTSVPGVPAAGAAYVFQRSGTVWTEEAKLFASDAAFDDWFGDSVALCGETILVGASNDEDPGPSGYGSGSAYIFDLCASSVQATETIRLGTPPNPGAFLPGVSSGPIVGATWDPVVTAFLPGAFVDFVAVDMVGPLNVPTGMGTLLIHPPPGPQILANPAPATPFALAIPADCGLVGVPAWTQGGSAAPGPVVALANALDIRFGNY